MKETLRFSDMETVVIPKEKEIKITFHIPKSLELVLKNQLILFECLFSKSVERPKLKDHINKTEEFLKNCKI